MSRAHKTGAATRDEHGTLRSYVIGFVLSLVSTVIPYYLVVNKAVTGSALLGVILGFAVLQMLIQIFFFLHLGRGPKPLYNIVFFVSTVGLILVVVFGSIFIMNHLYYNMAPDEVSKKLAEDEGIYQVGGKETGACRGSHANHKVIIRDGKVSPESVQAHHCDMLTFINEDDTLREITFGAHPNHGSYGGDADVMVRKGRAKTIVLNQLGEYHYHDHLDPDVTGDFTVTADPAGTHMHSHEGMR